MFWEIYTTSTWKTLLGDNQYAWRYYHSMFKGKLTESVKNQICCITQFKGKMLKLTLWKFNNSKMGLIVAFMLSHAWYSLSTRQIPCFTGIFWSKKVARSFIWLLQNKKGYAISKCKWKSEKEYCKICMINMHKILRLLWVIL